MADEQNDDVLDLTPDAILEQGEQNDPDVASPSEPAEEFAIEIEGEEATDETPLIKQLREQIRERDRELSAVRKVDAPKIEVGKEPDLWDDCEGDPDKYKQALLDWNERKRQSENAEADANRIAQERNVSFQRRLIDYQSRAAALPVKDFQTAQDTIVSTLPEMLQSALLLYTDSPEKVVYALAKHPAKLAELAKETDPIRFVLAVNNIERNLKVVNRAKPPAPESQTIQSGTASLATTSDKEEQRLEKEAERTNDYTNLLKYRRNKRKAA